VRGSRIAGAFLSPAPEGEAKQRMMVMHAPNALGISARRRAGTLYEC
jgi:hypothetical protein